MENREKRYFQLIFVCENCNKKYPLHQLKDNFMDECFCPNCEHRIFKIKKKKVTETYFNCKHGNNKIVWKEITRVNYHGVS